MGSEECDERSLCVETEGVVVQVYGMEVWQVEDRGQKGGQGLGDFIQEATSEDVGEVCDLCVC